MRGLLLVMAMCIAGTSSAQVINMETRRLHTDTIRRAGEFNFAFLFNNTNDNTLLTFRGNLVVQLKSKSLKDIWLMASNYDLAKAEGANFVNASFLHLRYNRLVNKWLRWEAFSQIQANEPLGINFRWLSGTGPRAKMHLGSHSHLYAGLAYMYEYERSTDKPPVKLYDHRASSYVSFSLTIPGIKGDLVSTAYWQPLFNDISDYRFTNDTRIDFTVAARFKLYTRFNYFFDSSPPEGIRQHALNVEQGFGIHF